MIILPKIFKQKTKYTCGPAALAMIFQYYGIEKTEEELALLARSTPTGTENQNMVDVARQFGFVVEYKQNSSIVEIKQFVDGGVPIIVLWFSPEADGHFSVVIEVDSEEIVLADPLVGRERKMKIASFLNRWFELDNYPPQNAADFTLREIIVIRPSIIK